jgi:pimeloyl-ACP methyl ester carboxylesterase
MSANEQIAVERFGSGQAILLLHGGARPEATWDRQMELAERWSLIIPTRRGFAPSTSAPAEDLEVDAGDVDRLLTKRTHLVGFDYGALALAIAALENPTMVRSLTLIDPPAEFTREARIDLDALAKLGIPVMVVSGGGDAGIESASDTIAERLRGRREIVPGEGEPVPRTPGFNDVLEDFLRGSAGTARFRTA